MTTEEIERILLSDVLKRDVVEGETAQKARNRVKKAAAKVLRARKADKDESEDDAASELEMAAETSSS